MVTAKREGYAMKELFAVFALMVAGCALAHANDAPEPTTNTPAQAQASTAAISAGRNGFARRRKCTGKSLCETSSFAMPLSMIRFVHSTVHALTANRSIAAPMPRTHNPASKS